MANTCRRPCCRSSGPRYSTCFAQSFGASTEASRRCCPRRIPAGTSSGRFISTWRRTSGFRNDPSRSGRYTTGLSPQGKAQHRPLGEAVRASSSARDKNRLLTLLEPVRRAAAQSPFVRELVDSGELFNPLSWNPQEAYRFLRETHALEESGVVVRVPDWWQRRSRPQVSMAVGEARPTVLGVDAMLDFSVKLTLDGEELTEADSSAGESSADGLVLLKGKWVEMDRAKLDQVLTTGVRSEASRGRHFLHRGHAAARWRPAR